MATLKERLEKEKYDFDKALKGEFTQSNGERLEIMNVQKKFIQDAIPSIDYMLMILKGDVVLPKENESVDTSWGKVFEWMQGSLVNITMAETIVYGKWEKVTDCFKCMYMSFADYVNEQYEKDDTNDTTDNDIPSLADEVNNADDDGVIHFPEDMSFADEVNETPDDDDDDYYCHYVGERKHGYLCDCLDIPDDCRDC